MGKKDEKDVKKYHQSRFLEARLVRQADGELKNDLTTFYSQVPIISTVLLNVTGLIFEIVRYVVIGMVFFISAMFMAVRLFNLQLILNLPHLELQKETSLTNVQTRPPLTDTMTTDEIQQPIQKCRRPRVGARIKLQGIV